MSGHQKFFFLHGTEIAMQRLLRENVRFMQAASRVIGRLLLNRVPLQQERLFSNVRANPTRSP